MPDEVATVERRWEELAETSWPHLRAPVGLLPGLAVPTA